MIKSVILKYNDGTQREIEMRNGLIYINSRRKYLIGAKYYYFTIKGMNGEIIGSSETYTQKHNVLEVIDTYFYCFQVIDNTIKPEKK